MTKTIETQVETELIIKKSRFIGILKPLSDIQLVPSYLAEIRCRYPDATHYCYAYRVDGAIRANDDGEPARTAGAPILNVLEKNHLDHILAVVVRYFGGIKLGAGGLVRAYSQAAAEALANAHIVTKIRAPYYRISFPYSLIRQMDHFCKQQDIEILVKDYQEDVHYECFIVSKSILETLAELFQNHITFNCLKYDDVTVKEENTCAN